jgi:hypothetical protein
LSKLEKEIDPVKGLITTCQYCNANYVFTREDINALLKEVVENTYSSKSSQSNPPPNQSSSP